MTRPSGVGSIEAIREEVIACRRCPRLVRWREQAAREKRAAFRAWDYWGRPVPGFGDPLARLLVVGLAPAAHGGNRTGRIFTGDRSGDWVYRALHATGFANQPTSVAAADGLALHDAYVTAVVRCAPPANRSTTEERDACLPFLTQELAALPHTQVIVALGGFAFDNLARLLQLRPRPRFGHGAEVPWPAAPGAGTAGTLLGCYHPSQRNTFTGKLTEPSFNAVFARARALVAAADAAPRRARGRETTSGPLAQSGHSRSLRECGRHLAWSSDPPQQRHAIPWRPNPRHVGWPAPQRVPAQG